MGGPIECKREARTSLALQLSMRRNLFEGPGLHFQKASLSRSTEVGPGVTSTENIPPVKNAPRTVRRMAPEGTISRASSILELGGSRHAEARVTREACRFHMPDESASKLRKNSPPPSPLQASRSLLEQCRYEDPAATRRSERWTQLATAPGPTAGQESRRCRLVAQLSIAGTSRARSATPDYHDRYLRNALGTTLPETARQSRPSTAIAAASAEQKPVCIWKPTASRATEDMCRFHGEEEVLQRKGSLQKQAFNFSSRIEGSHPPTPRMSSRPMSARGDPGMKLKWR